MSLALVYVARGIESDGNKGEGGLASAKAFFDAYRAFPAGCPHELIVIVKGWAGVAGQDELRQLAQAHAARLVDLPDDGFDCGAYMRLAPQLPHDWLCFLNTHSRPRVEGWLNLMKIAADEYGTDIGAVGATASWESLAKLLPMRSMIAENNNPLIYSLRLIRNVIPFLTRIRDFPYYPNPYLRFNAFLVPRRLFIDYAATQKFPRCKLDANKMENGRAGFSVYLANRGLKVLVAGADGKAYESDQWINSGTFRVPGQPNLLVADNRTILYDMMDPLWKREWERVAWGKTFS